MRPAGVLLAFFAFATPVRAAPVEAGIQDFRVQLSSPMNAVFADSSGGATIVDDVLISGLQR
jgi:hypothetical protein